MSLCQHIYICPLWHFTVNINCQATWKANRYHQTRFPTLQKFIKTHQSWRIVSSDVMYRFYCQLSMTKKIVRISLKTSGKNLNKYNWDCLHTVHLIPNNLLKMYMFIHLKIGMTRILPIKSTERNQHLSSI
jgi:hypothetical protein